LAIFNEGVFNNDVVLVVQNLEPRFRVVDEYFVVLRVDLRNRNWVPVRRRVFSRRVTEEVRYRNVFFKLDDPNKDVRADVFFLSEERTLLLPNGDGVVVFVIDSFEISTNVFRTIGRVSSGVYILVVNEAKEFDFFR